jgi:hypothetical protein
VGDEMEAATPPGAGRRATRQGEREGRSSLSGRFASIRGRRASQLSGQTRHDPDQTVDIATFVNRMARELMGDVDLLAARDISQVSLFR